MKLGVMQPYLFPYIGYFQLIHAVDKFIIYDDVNFIKNGWINRNNYLEKDKGKIFTLPIENVSSFKKINETYIKDNDSLKMRTKIIKTLKTNYSKAPYYNIVIKLCEEILFNPDNNIAKFNEYSIRKVCEFLRIQTEIIVSSDIEKNESLKAEERLINICKILNAKTYINSIGGKKLYNSENFKKNSIELKFIKTDSIEYTQFNDEFVPYLSIIDVLMFNGIEGTRELLNQFVLED